MRDLTLVFDLDGTLVDTAPDLVASTNHVLDHLGLPRVDEGDAAAVRRARRPAHDRARRGARRPRA